MAGAVRIETFPAPPILNLCRARDEEKDLSSQQSSPSLSTSPSPSTSPPSSSAPSASPLSLPSSSPTNEDDPPPPPRRPLLSLHLSRAETVEDEEVPSIQVEGSDPDPPPSSSSHPKGLKLQLSLAGVDVEDGVASIEAGGAALESRWQLKVMEAEATLKRASFEVTQEGILKTKNFEIGKRGFHRTTSATAEHSSPPASSSSPSLSSSPPSLPVPLPQTDRPHLDLSDATVVEMGLLGRGAGGKVLKSLHKPSMTVIALKCIDVSDKAKRAQLLKELKELDTAYCPHIVAFYGAYYHDLTCTVKLGLEYMSRGSLQAIVHEHGKLHELALTHVVKQSLQGLLHLHSNRKLHRDIKPGNILANHFGQTKLSDFGILAELNNSLAKCGTFVGTTIYMSPERLTSEAYSYPADVWSLGMSIITMATGAFPLSTEDGYWGLVMHFNTQPPPQLPENGGFSASFRDFISKCLVKEPAKRWAVKELLEHPWILNGCEAEEALTYWPEAARMFEPDAAVVKKQKEERMERTRKWEEAEEKKRQRKGLRSKPSIIKAEAEERKEQKPKAAESEEEEGAKVRHRRKAAITRFHPVGLLHLQAEAHVQNGKKAGRGKKEAKIADTLYGNGSDDEDDDDDDDTPTDGKRPSIEEASKQGLTARSRRALGALKGNGLAHAGAEGIDKATPLHPISSIVSPKRPSTLLSMMSSPSPDFNLVSPSRAARHNVKFVNGQILTNHPLASPPTPSSASTQSSSTFVPLPHSLAKQVSAPAQLTYEHESSAVALPSLQGMSQSLDASPTLTPSSTMPSLPALAHTPQLSSSGPPNGSSMLAKPKVLSPLTPDQVGTRDRAQSTGTVSSSPLPSQSSSTYPLIPLASPSLQPLPPALPHMHRGSPSLHRRSPSVPAVSASSYPPAISLAPSSPHGPPIGIEQRRALRTRRPSMTSNGPVDFTSPSVPSSRSIVKLPSLQTTAEADIGPSEEKSTEERHKGLGKRGPSISSSFGSDLPPVTPIHFRSMSHFPLPSPFLPTPLSPRSARILSMISQSELDDVTIILQSLLERYREREQTEKESARPEVDVKRSVESEEPSASVTFASSSSLSDGSSECSTPSSDQQAERGWPSWLPDEIGLQEDLERVADQVGIRISIIAHFMRKILSTN